MVLVFLLHSLFASIFTAAKLGLAHGEPFFLLGFRMVIASGILILYSFLRHSIDFKEIWTQHKKTLFGLALFNIYLTNGLEFWGLQYLTSAKTSFLYSLSPFFSAIFSYFCFKETLSHKKWLGLLVGFIGFIPILLPESVQEASLWELGFVSSAELSVMGAAAATIYGWVLMRQLIEKGVSPLVANGISMGLGGLMALIHSLLTEHWNPTPVFGDWTVFSRSVLWQIIVSSLICYNLYGYLLRRYTVTFISFCAFIIPFMTALFGWFVMAEPLPAYFFISGGIVGSGLVLFYLEELKKEGMTRG
jgi:drug/metabolite transporter (DMT)-like permease